MPQIRHKINKINKIESKTIDSFFNQQLDDKTHIHNIINNDVITNTATNATTDSTNIATATATATATANIATTMYTSTSVNYATINDVSTINPATNTNTIQQLTRQEILANLNNHSITFSLIEIKNKIINLSEHELKEVFKIIKNNNEKYSTNTNGIFINLNILKKITIQDISNFLYFSDNNKILDELDERERSKYKNLIDINI